jgi:hypothetical protein
MSTTSLDPYAPPSHDTRQPELRIAIVLEDERGREALVATLAAGGLPVNAGALTLNRLGELADPGSPP